MVGQGRLSRSRGARDARNLFRPAARGEGEAPDLPGRLAAALQEREQATDRAPIAQPGGGEQLLRVAAAPSVRPAPVGRAVGTGTVPLRTASVISVVGGLTRLHYGDQYGRAEVRAHAHLAARSLVHHPRDGAPTCHTGSLPKVARDRRWP